MSEISYKTNSSSEKYASFLGLKILIYIRLHLGRKICSFLVAILIFWIWCFFFFFIKYSKDYLKILNNYQKKYNIPLTKFSTLKHMYFYALTLIDRIDTFLAKSIPINIDPDSTKDWTSFLDYAQNKKGCFLLFCHVGNIYVLPNIKDQYKKASSTSADIYMDIERTPIFHNMMLNKNKTQNIFFHSTKNMDIKTGYDILSQLDSSHVILMGVDRIENKNPKHIKKVSILDKPCFLSKAIFKIALSPNVPIFFVSCLKEHKNYYLYIREYKNSTNIEDDFANFMQEMILKNPINWCNWFDFFSSTNNSKDIL